MAELSERLKQDIEEACKRAGLTTPTEDLLRALAVLAALGWVWYKKSKAGKQKESKDD